MEKNTLTVSIEILLERSSFKQMSSNTKVFFDSPREQNSKKVQLSHIQFIPAAGQSILLVKAQTRTDGKTYKTTVEFNKVDYKKVNNPYAVTLAVDGQEIKFMPINSMQNEVRVHCTCMDFYWRFAMYNSKDDSLIGEPPAPYVKKTDRAPLNPEKVPAVCKHLMAVADHCRMQKYIK